MDLDFLDCFEGNFLQHIIEKMQFIIFWHSDAFFCLFSVGYIWAPVSTGVTKQQNLVANHTENCLTQIWVGFIKDCIGRPRMHNARV